jgi:hypothetical protein
MSFPSHRTKCSNSPSIIWKANGSLINLRVNWTLMNWSNVSINIGMEGKLVTSVYFQSRAFSSHSWTGPFPYDLVLPEPTPKAIPTAHPMLISQPFSLRWSIPPPSPTLWRISKCVRAGTGCVCGDCFCDHPPVIFWILTPMLHQCWHRTLIPGTHHRIKDRPRFFRRIWLWRFRP